MNAKNVLSYAADQEARFVSVRFTDLIGSWHHLTFPITQLSEDSFEDGFGFDASSLRGWAAIHESDMLLVPDPSRFWIDPFTEDTTLCLIANAVDPITKEGYWLDPRSVAQRAESYLKFTGIADTINVGPEAEFFIFDEANFPQPSARSPTPIRHSAAAPPKKQHLRPYGGGRSPGHKRSPPSPSKVGMRPQQRRQLLVQVRNRVVRLLFDNPAPGGSGTGRLPFQPFE